jgi:hypothetical protein
VENRAATCPKPERSIAARQLCIITRKAASVVDEFRSWEVRASLRDPERPIHRRDATSGNSHMQSLAKDSSPTSPYALPRQISFALPPEGSAQVESPRDEMQSDQKLWSPSNVPLQEASTKPNESCVIQVDEVDALDQTAQEFATRAARAELLCMESLRREPSRETTVTLQISKVLERNRARRVVCFASTGLQYQLFFHL